MEVFRESSSLLLVAKFPTRGFSKTRLFPILGEDGALCLARAMLADLLRSFSTAAGLKILYTPGHSLTAATDFCCIACPSGKQWSVHPMGGGINDLASSDLSSLLSHALRTWSTGCVTFIGSDCPHLPKEEWEIGVKYAFEGGAYICPASDGGYVLLTLPPDAPSEVFEKVIWSDVSTCVTQIEAIRAAGIKVTVGRTYTDIDDRTDIEYFKELEVQSLLLDLEVEKQGSVDMICDYMADREGKGEEKDDEEEEERGEGEDKGEADSNVKSEVEGETTQRMNESKKVKEMNRETQNVNITDKCMGNNTKIHKRDTSEFIESDLIESGNTSISTKMVYHVYDSVSAVNHELSAYQNNCAQTRAFLNQLIHS